MGDYLGISKIKYFKISMWCKLIEKLRLCDPLNRYEKTFD